MGSALAIGTVHMPALFVVSALALLGASLEMLSTRRVPWPAAVLAGLGLYSALQAIPLPAWLANRASAEIWSHCLGPFGEPALVRFPASLDAGASLAEALKWVTYACVYILATRMRARRGSTWLALLLFGSATLVALITLAHGVADLRVLYGVYEPHFGVGRWNVGPLLNSNNLAGYAILGLASGGGLVLSGRSPLPHSVLSVGLAVIVTALALSGSRGAVLSVLISGAVTLVWLAKGQRIRFWLRTAALGMIPLAIGIAIAVSLGTAKEANQFGLVDVQRKVSVWLWSLPMIREHALFGVGRGAFETAFPPYRQALDYDWAIVVTHAENFVVHWVAEWGIPVGLSAVVVIVGYLLREWFRSTGNRLHFMLMTGLLALFVQNLADLGLEIPALAIAAIVALAGGERLKADTRPARESENGLGWLVLAASAPAFALWAAALVWSRFPVDIERRAMSVAYRELAVKNPDKRARFHAQLRDAVLRHPGEPFFPLLGGLLAMRTRDSDPLPWLARSLALAPTNGPVNLMLAELLHTHGATTQAMLHLRRAAQYDRTLTGAVGARAARWAPSVDLLMQAMPEGRYRADMFLDACSREQQIV
ncbi:MAG TPA: O-antigen ligase family protein, partial [Polyangiaceae bacterium]|nr:O-antigen ligase family protein [Polyangiaceae bacterium]